MNELVTIINGKATTTSLKVAEVFEKQHKDVLRALQSLDVPPDFNGRNFTPVEYTDAKGEKRPMYTITRDGFTLLAMGFTGAKAMQFKLAYIAAFNEMEAALKSGGDEITHQLADEIRKKAESKVAHDIAALRNTISTFLHDRGYSIDKALLDSLTMTGPEKSDPMYWQQINKAIRQIVDPRLTASVKLSLEAEEREK